ncbi:IMP dehydrogenase [Chitinispirillales bacterium ANBcel5]|uniref:IMP dehydrogenase n=1 Tax=Cellulosispirillum alkaliphilum TaxID=3039283 RepID=UPI002A50C667|nr:IMP dehydrogenase [Chitinispirillales bacterium ANBcel5]
MARIIDEVSRTFSEYLLLPRLTRQNNVPQNVCLQAAISRYKKDETPSLSLNIPFVSSSMQAVSGPDMAIALARRGGIGFIFCSQSVENQAAMIRKVKSHKAGFVPSDSNLKADSTLRDALTLRQKNGHSTMPVTQDGSKNGKFLGILTDKDYWEFEDDLDAPVSEFMTNKENVVYGTLGITLHEANRLLRKHKKECLPILDKDENLHSLVFRKDYFDHMNNPDELLDHQKRLVVGAGVNTHDYKDRIPALVEAGVDVVCFDSSDGYSEFQKDAALWTRKEYGDKIVIGGGNIIDAEAFRFLAEEAQLDFVKVGIGGGSICITREQKGIGRGQASALFDVTAERDRYFKESGTYVPVCSDGGLANDTQIIIALAMGADFVMMGRYFAMTDESPTPRVSIGGRIYKPYWGEGSNRARNWQRYSESESGLKFEEGVDAYVPVVGSVKEVLGVTVSKIRSTMCNMGSLTLKEFSENSVLTRISEQSFVEGGTSNVVSLDKDIPHEV